MQQDRKYSPEEFGNRIKAKAPGSYDDINPVTLSRKMSEKYPEYKDAIDWGPEGFEQTLLKQEDGTLLPVGTELSQKESTPEPQESQSKEQDTELKPLQSKKKHPSKILETGFSVMDDTDQKYFNSLLKDFGGVPEYAIVANDWGESNASLWLQEGADQAKLPEHIREKLPEAVKEYEGLAEKQRLREQSEEFKKHPNALDISSQKARQISLFGFGASKPKSFKDHLAQVDRVKERVTAVDSFIAENPDLTDREKGVLEEYGWGKPIEEVQRIMQMQDHRSDLKTQIDELQNKYESESTKLLSITEKGTSNNIGGVDINFSMISGHQRKIDDIAGKIDDIRKEVSVIDENLRWEHPEYAKEKILLIEEERLNRISSLEKEKEELLQQIEKAGEPKEGEERETKSRSSIEGYDKDIAAKGELYEMQGRVKDIDDEITTLQPGYYDALAEHTESKFQERMGKGRFWSMLYEKADALRKAYKVNPITVMGIKPANILDTAKALNLGAVQVEQSYYGYKAHNETNPLKRDMYMSRFEVAGRIMEEKLALQHPDIVKVLTENPDDLDVWYAEQLGVLTPVVGSFMASSAAGSKAGAAIGSIFGPKGSAIGTIAGGMIGSYLAGYASYVGSMYGEARMGGASHEAARDAAKKYAPAASAASIVVPSLMTSAFLGAFGKNYIQNTMVSNTLKMMALGGIAEPTGELIAQVQVMTANELATGIKYSDEDWTNTMWNTLASTMVMGTAMGAAAGGRIQGTRADVSGKFQPININNPQVRKAVENSISEYMDVVEKMDISERPHQTAFLMERLTKAQEQGSATPEMNTLLDYLGNVQIDKNKPISDAVSLIDQVSIEVVNRSKQENFDRLNSLMQIEEAMGLSMEEAIEYTAIMSNDPIAFGEWQDFFVAQNQYEGEVKRRMSKIANEEFVGKLSNKDDGTVKYLAVPEQSGGVQSIDQSGNPIGGPSHEVGEYIIIKGDPTNKPNESVFVVPVSQALDYARTGEGLVKMDLRGKEFVENTINQDDVYEAVFQSEVEAEAAEAANQSIPENFSMENLRNNTPFTMRTDDGTVRIGRVRAAPEPHIGIVVEFLDEGYTKGHPYTLDDVANFRFGDQMETDVAAQQEMEDAAATQQAQETQETPVETEERMGQQNVAFFSGKAKEASSKKVYEPVIQLDQSRPISQAYNKYTDGGNFTGHISKMIPGFAEKQQQVGHAIAESEAKSFLDIGTSEGGLIKAVGAVRPDIRILGVDPNRDMKANFDSTPEVSNAEYRVEAFMGEWTEEDGFEVPRFKTDEKFDVINEDFTFQFINNNRKAQVAEVKKMLNPGGLFVTSEKFKNTRNQAANEAKKYNHQRNYFSPEQLTEDKQSIITGMDADMVNDVEYFNILKDNFKHVAEFWNAGNFKGYVASDNLAALQQFVDNVGDLTTDYTDHGSLTAQGARTEVVMGPEMQQAMETGEITREALPLSDGKLRTHDGIEMTPPPQDVNNRKHVDKWLHENALALAKQDPSRGLATLIESMNPDNITKHERRVLNGYLFNQDNTPTLKTDQQLSVEPETQESVSKKVAQELGIDVGGKVSLFHYSTAENIMKDGFDPSRVGQHAHTTQKRRFGSTFFYGDSRKESLISGNPFVAKVDPGKLYPIMTDPLGLTNKILERGRKAAEKNGWAPPTNSPESISEFAPLVLREMGYEGLYAPWTFDKGPKKHSGFRVELFVPKEVDVQGTENLRKYNAVTPTVQDVKTHLDNEISNKLRPEVDSARGLESGLTSLYYSQDGITDKLLSNPLVQKLVPEKMINQRRELKEAIRFTDPTKTILNHGEYAVISAENPSGQTLTAEENAIRTQRLKERLDKLGYQYKEQKGVHNSIPETSFLIEGMDGDLAFDVAKEFFQESLITNEGFIYTKDGSLYPILKDRLIFNDGMSDNYSQVAIGEANIKYAMDYDWGNRLQFIPKKKKPSQIIKDSPEFTGTIPTAVNIDIAMESTGIKNPVASDPSAQFVLVSDLIEKLGVEKTHKLLQDAAPWLNNSEALTDTGFDSVSDMIAQDPDVLNSLILNAPELYAIPIVLDALYEAGFDGAYYFDGRDQRYISFNGEAKPPAKPDTRLSLDKVLADITSDYKELNGYPKFAPERIAAGDLDIKYFYDNYGLSMKKNKVAEVGRALTENEINMFRGRKYKINDLDSKENQTRIAQRIASVIKERIIKRGNDIDKKTGLKLPNPVGWYSRSLNEALDIVKKIYPEVGWSPSDEFVFKVAWAITSQEQDVYANTKNALVVYGEFLKSGQKTIPEIGFGTKVNAMAGNFRKVNDLYKKFGQDWSKVEEFIRTEKTKREFANEGYEISAGYAEDVVPGSAIFGPKIGTAFLSNLLGNRNYITVDLWMARMLGRMTGTLTEKTTEGTRIKHMSDLREAIRNHVAEGRNPFIVEGLSEDVVTGKRKVYADVSRRATIFDPEVTVDALMNDDALLIQYAEDLHKVYARGENTGEVDPKTKKPKKKSYIDDKKTDIVLAAKTMYSGLEMKGAPTDKDIHFLTNATRQAAKILERDGISIDIPDIQATGWYLEKEIYREFGATNSRSESANYADGAQEVAIAKGISKEEINNIRSKYDPLYEQRERHAAKEKKNKKKLGLDRSQISLFEEAFNLSNSNISQSAKKSVSSPSVLSNYQNVSTRISELQEMSGSIADVMVVPTNEVLFDRLQQRGVSLENINNIKRQVKKGDVVTGMKSTVNGDTQIYFVSESITKTGRNIDQLWLHEMSHHGIEKLIPNTYERADFFNKIVNDVGLENIKTQFTENQWQYMSEQGNEYIAGEYLSKIAEKLDLKKTLSKQEKTFWQKFMDSIRNLLSRILWDKRVKLDDKSIENIARATIREIMGDHTRVDKIRTPVDILTKAPKRNIAEMALQEDIRLSIEGKDGEIETQSLGMPVHLPLSPRQVAARFIQHRHIGVDMQIREVMKRKGVDLVPDYANFPLAADRVKSKVTYEREQIVKTKVDPMIRAHISIVEKTGVSSQDVIDYMFALHAPEAEQALANKQYEKEVSRNQSIKKNMAELSAILQKGEKSTEAQARISELVDQIDKTKTKIREKADKNAEGKSGIKDPQAIITDFETKVPRELREDLRKTRTALTHSILDYLTKSGLLSAENNALLKNRYKEYIPYQGWDQALQDQAMVDQFDYIDRNSYRDGTTNPLRKREGRTTKAGNPYEALMAMIQGATIAGEKNIAAGYYLNFARWAGDQAVDTKGENRILGIKDYYEVMDENTGAWNEVDYVPEKQLFDDGLARRSENKGHEKYKPQSMASQHEINIFENGKKVTVVTDPAVANRINGMSDWWTQLPERSMLQYTRFLGRMLTARNPYFWAVNWGRDIGFSTPNHMIEQGAMFTKDFLGNVVNAGKLTYKHSKGRLAPKYDRMGNPLNNDAYFEEWKKNGGPTGFVHMWDQKRIKSWSKDAIRELSDKNVLTRAQGMYRTFLGSMDAIAEVSENSTRFASYLAARKNGKSVVESVRISKDGDVNFDRRGDYTGAFASVYAFFNPAVQGVERHGRLWRQNPGKTATFAIAMIAGAYFKSMMQDIQSEEDEFGDKEFDKSGKARRLHTGLWQIPGTEIDVLLPLPHSWRGYHGIGAALYNLHSGRSDSREFLNDVTSIMLTSHSPIGRTFGAFQEDGMSVQNTIGAFMPTMLTAPYEAFISNKDFVGRDITPVPFTRGLDESIPMAFRYGPRTSELSKGISKHMFELSGGVVPEAETEIDSPKTPTRFKLSDSGRAVKTPSALDISPAQLDHLFNNVFGAWGKIGSDAYRMVQGAVNLAQTMEYKLDDETTADLIRENFKLQDIPFIQRFARPRYGEPVRSDYYDLMEQVRRYNMIFDTSKEEDIDDIASSPVGSFMLSYKEGIFKEDVKVINELRDEIRVVENIKDQGLWREGKTPGEIRKEEARLQAQIDRMDRDMKMIMNILRTEYKNILNQEK